MQIFNCNPFGRIPIDQATEVTVNKNTQTPGGTTRFSLNSGAVKQHYITAEYRSAFLGLIRSIVQGCGKILPHFQELFIIVCMHVTIYVYTLFFLFQLCISFAHTKLFGRHILFCITQVVRFKTSIA